MAVYFISGRTNQQTVYLPILNKLIFHLVYIKISINLFDRCFTSCTRKIHLSEGSRHYGWRKLGSARGTHDRPKEASRRRGLPSQRTAVLICNRLQQKDTHLPWWYRYFTGRFTCGFCCFSLFTGSFSFTVFPSTCFRWFCLIYVNHVLIIAENSC